jgi:hypothetical protein
MMSPAPLVALPPPVRRDSAPECEAGAPPDIPEGRVVVLLKASDKEKPIMEPVQAAIIYYSATGTV